VSEIIRRLNFFGQTYDLKAQGTDVDFGQLIEYVQVKIKEIEEKHPTLPNHRMVVLTVLSIATDYMLAQKHVEDIKISYSKWADNLVSRIEQAIEVEDGML